MKENMFPWGGTHGPPPPTKGELPFFKLKMCKISILSNIYWLWSRSEEEKYLYICQSKRYGILYLWGHLWGFPQGGTWTFFQNKCARYCPHNPKWNIEKKTTQKAGMKYFGPWGCTHGPLHPHGYTDQNFSSSNMQNINPIKYLLNLRKKKYINVRLINMVHCTPGGTPGGSPG